MAKNINLNKKELKRNLDLLSSLYAVEEKLFSKEQYKDRDLKVNTLNEIKDKIYNDLALLVGDIEEESNFKKEEYFNNVVSNEDPFSVENFIDITDERLEVLKNLYDLLVKNNWYNRYFKDFLKEHYTRDTKFFIKANSCNIGFVEEIDNIDFDILETGGYNILSIYTEDFNPFNKENMHQYYYFKQ